MSKDRLRHWLFQLFAVTFLIVTLPFTGPGYLILAIGWTYRKITGRKESRSSLHRSMSHDPGGL